MNWKFSGDRPVYQQICELIRGAVLTGELKPGQRIPSVREIAAQCGISRTPIRCSEPSANWSGRSCSGPAAPADGR